MIHHATLRNLGDLGASMLWLLSLLSQWAQLLTPIATLLLTILGIVWWTIRFCEWLKTKKTGEIE